MNWFNWALLSAAFAGLTAVLAKVGVKGIDPNLATAIRTTVVLALAWTIVAVRGVADSTMIAPSAGLFLTLSGWQPVEVFDGLRDRRDAISKWRRKSLSCEGCGAWLRTSRG